MFVGLLSLLLLRVIVVVVVVRAASNCVDCGIRLTQNFLSALVSCRTHIGQVAFPNNLIGSCIYAFPRQFCCVWLRSPLGLSGGGKKSFNRPWAFSFQFSGVAESSTTLLVFFHIGRSCMCTSRRSAEKA